MKLPLWLTFMGCDMNKRPAWILSRIIVGSRSESLNCGGFRCRLIFVALVPLYKVSQTRISNQISSETGVALICLWTSWSWAQQVVYWSSVKDFKIRKHHPKKCLWLHNQESLWFIDGRVHGSIKGRWEKTHFLLSLTETLLCDFFLYFIIWMNKTQRLRFTRTFHSCCIWKQDY